MNSAGLRGAVLLLTDGGAGRDQYPWRDTDTHYPPYDLVGEELAETRVAEAREAIGWLGTAYYLRYGLVNHPYNSIEEELSPQDIIGIWDPAGELVERLATTIRALQPEILLSPDGPAETYEHFEHEASGILVRRALERLRAEDADPVRLHLLAVDPLQTASYDELFAMSPWDRAADGTVPRLRQIYALRAHRTQRDASVVGVETRMALPLEYYALDGARPTPEIASLLGLRSVDHEPERPYPLALRRTE
jgi:LmbE family N-acetylglucosaminyl deacetylase